MTTVVKRDPPETMFVKQEIKDKLTSIAKTKMKDKMESILKPQPTTVADEDGTGAADE